MESIKDFSAKNINARDFKRFGRVIEYPGKNLKGKKKNLFCVVLRENKKSGWRIAYLVVRDKKINRLEQHPESYESFEPVKGRSLLYVAVNKAAESVSRFYLDKPVILKKGIWHGVVSLDKEAQIKITEDAKVKCVYWRPDFVF